MERLAIPQGMHTPYSGLYFDSVGRLILGHTEDVGSDRKWLKRYSLLRKNDNSHHSYDGIPSSNAMKYYAYSITDDPLKGIVQVYDSANILKQTINLYFSSVSKWKKSYIYFMGDDRQEYLYFYTSVESTNAQGGEDIILKYDQKGALIASVSVTEPIIRSGAISHGMGLMFAYYRVHPRGDVYFAYPLKSSFVLVRAFPQAKE